MAYFDRLLENLTDAELAAREASDFGALSAAEAIKNLKDFRSELQRAERMPASSAPRQTFSDAEQWMYENLGSLLADLHAYAQSGPESGLNREQLANRAQELFTYAVRNVRPYVILDSSTDEKKVAELIDQLNEASDRYEKATQVVRDENAEAVASALGTFYGDEARAHAEVATTWLYVALAGVIGVVLAAVLGFFVWPPHPDGDLSTSRQVIEFGGDVIGRAILLSLAGYIAGFGARNYRVNMHLGTQNRRRHLALQASNWLREANSEPTARNIIITELVSSLFSSEETGYLGGEPERTVIESHGPAAALLRTVNQA